MRPFIYLLLLLTGILNAQVNPTLNKISMDVSTFPQNSSYNYDSCFAVGKNLGMQQVGIFQNWTALETSPNVYDFTILDIANIYYPAYNMPLDLTIAPIHTNKLEVPSDLVSTTFNSTVMISRFNKLLDSLKAHMPNITLSSLVIGSEHDVYMGSNAALWSNYTVFYNAVTTHAKVLWPGLNVATELTFDGIINYNSFAQSLNTNSDHIGISYYPLNSNFTVKPVSVVPNDFATLVGFYPSKKLWFYQYGYPSSTVCNSSNALQSQFITQTFLSWDVYAANIRMIDFTWLHDLDPVQVNYWGTYYGLTNPAFLEFLRTLGFRTYNGNGTDKPALNELRCQAKQRGYNSLPLNCTVTNLNENENSAELIVFPNPTADVLNIQLPHVKSGKIFIRDILGKRVEELNFSEKINITHLKNGIYFITISDKTNNSNYTTKVIVNK
ncbi:MAG: T9SS type A sorting domain-containing protein [Bacteroidota bacterium]|nr:T9SS type A sorting domain-containing protein [Bacteroidota bacterium]